MGKLLARQEQKEKNRAKAKGFTGHCPVFPEVICKTKKDYLNSINNHLAPWFKEHPVQLHEIRYDTLCQLLGDIKRSGKGKLNVMYCLHRCLDYAWKSERIPLMPPFPERSKYNIVNPVIEWLPEDRQSKSSRRFPRSTSLSIGG